MNQNMNKKTFVKQMAGLGHADRGVVISELISTSSGRMFDNMIPGAFRKEIAKIISKFLHKGKLSPKDAWKLWVFTMKPADDLKNWRVTGDQCYRIKPTGTVWAYQRSKPNCKATPARRQTIRDVNGNAVPRRWLDRFCPQVKTQADWDQRSCFKTNKHQL
jgi:hypothetical protein